MTPWATKPGAPYNVIYNLAPSADGKTITWMSNPAHSGDRAVARFPPTPT